MCTFEVDVIGVDGQAVDRMGREKSDGKGSREGKGPEKEPGVEGKVLSHIDMEKL